MRKRWLNGHRIIIAGALVTAQKSVFEMEPLWPIRNCPLRIAYKLYSLPRRRSALAAGTVMGMTSPQARNPNRDGRGV